MENKKRNSMTINIKELVNLAENLFYECEKKGINVNTKFEIPIVNKAGVKDGWKFEQKYERLDNYKGHECD